MSWLKRERTGIKQATQTRPREMPEGLWTKCDGCGEALFRRCSRRTSGRARTVAITSVSPRVRAWYLADPDSFHERHTNLVAGDPLQFRDAKMPYPERLARPRRTPARSTRPSAASPPSAACR
jgi:acetyl-CoA carboxylase carboxyl transferase subunit beta